MGKENRIKSMTWKVGKETVGKKRTTLIDIIVNDRKLWCFMVTDVCCITDIC